MLKVGDLVYRAVIPTGANINEQDKGMIIRVEKKATHLTSPGTDFWVEVFVGGEIIGDWAGWWKKVTDDKSGIGKNTKT